MNLFEHVCKFETHSLNLNFWYMATRKHTHASSNAVTLVWGLLRLTPINIHTCSTNRCILHSPPPSMKLLPMPMCLYVQFSVAVIIFHFHLPMVMFMVHWSWVLGWNRLAYLYNCLVRVFFILYTLHQVHGNIFVDLGHPKWIYLNK